MGFDVFPHHLYDIKNRQRWLTIGTATMMNNVTIAHTNILQTMLAQFHALCLSQNTQSEQHRVHTPVNNTHLETKP